MPDSLMRGNNALARILRHCGAFNFVCNSEKRHSGTVPQGRKIEKAREAKTE